MRDQAAALERKQYRGAKGASSACVPGNVRSESDDDSDGDVEWDACVDEGLHGSS